MSVAAISAVLAFAGLILPSATAAAETAARAVPADGRKSLDAAYTDPTACEQIGSERGVCWRYWQRIGEEVRIWTTYQGRSCVLIASLDGAPTRILCDGHTVTESPEPHRSTGATQDAHSTVMALAPGRTR